MGEYEYGKKNTSSDSRKNPFCLATFTKNLLSVVSESMIT